MEDEWRPKLWSERELLEKLCIPKEGTTNSRGKEGGMTRGREKSRKEAVEGRFGLGPPRVAQGPTGTEMVPRREQEN